MAPTGRPAPGFVGRIGDVVDARRRATFQVLRTRELTNRVKGMPFDWTVNPFRGCELGCRYCYARPTHTYLGHEDPGEFEERIYVKRPEDGGLEAALRRARDRGQEVAIGTATDPYQPAEGRFRVTRMVLETAARVPGLALGVTTKSPAVLDDLPVLRRIAERSRLTVHVSLISLDAGLIRRLEPRAARPDRRLAALEALARAGIATRLFVMPVLPGLTDGPEALAALLRAARAAGAAEVSWNVLFLRGSTRGFFLETITREFPSLLPRYRALYAGGAYADAAYRREVDALMRDACRAAGFPARPRPGGAAPPDGSRQLALVW